MEGCPGGTMGYWRWQMQNAIRTTSQLAEFLPIHPRTWQPGTSRTAVQTGDSALLLLADRFGQSVDPIALQSLPSTQEMTSTSGQELQDPLEEDKDSPVPVSLTVTRPGTFGNDTRLLDVLSVLHAETRDHGPRRLGCTQPQ